MRFILAGLFSLMLQVGYSDVPRLLIQKTFTATDLAEAANCYVAMGETATVKEFAMLSTRQSHQGQFIPGTGFDVNERIGWLCRILFQPDGHSPLRPPKFGVLPLPGKTMSPKNWPLFPVALSGSTYFVLKEGYMPEGTPETLEHYLAYCHGNGIFRKTLVFVPNRQQARMDAANLRKSAPWLAIKWYSEQDFNFPLGEQLTWSFVQNQTSGIPKQLAARQNSKLDATAVTLR
jgi:hypothetical protein